MLPTSDLTVLLLTYNEQDNIGRTLDALRWAPQVLVVDSFSTDGTLEVIRCYPNVRVLQRVFDTHAAQWNFGLDNVETEWVLSLDADYVVAPTLEQEIVELSAPDEIAAYAVKFRYCINRRPLRATLLPPRLVLFRKSRCRYVQEGHTQLLRVDGGTAALRSTIDHDDLKPLARWLDSQRKYAALEAEHLLNADPRRLSRVDRLRRNTCLAPFLSLGYTLFWKRLILDGPPGWFYCLQRAYAELLLTLHLLDARLNRR